MQGVFLQSARDLVVQKFGSKFWKKLSSAGHLPEEFESQRIYDEEAMYSLTRELAKILGLSSNKSMQEAFGYWFVRYAKCSDLGKSFSLLGPKFIDALKNLNQITSINGSGLQSSLLPTVRCTIEGESAARLQLSSPSGKDTRRQSAPFVIGMIKGIAEDLYSINAVTITQERERDPNKESRIGSESNCDEFRITWADAPAANGAEKASSNGAPGTPADSPPPVAKLAKRDSSVTYSVGLPPAQLAILFPFHFIFNRHLELIQYGPSLAKILGSAIAHGKKVSPLFQAVEPSQTSEWTFQDAESWSTDSVSFRFTVERAGAPRTNGEDNARNSTIAVTLRGQLLAYRTSRSDHTVIGFFGSPVMRGSDAANALNLHLADFALHDPAKEGLFVTTTPESAPAPRSVQNGEKSKKKDRALRIDPKDVKEKLGTTGVLRAILGSKYEDTSYESGASGSTFAASGPLASIRMDQSRVEALLGDADITTARRGSMTSTASTNGSNSSSLSIFSLVENLSDSQNTSVVSSNSRITSAFQELLVQDSWHRFKITTSLLRAALERTPPKDCEDFFQAIVRFCGFRNRLTDLLATVLDDEIAMALSGTANSGVFLRTDSIATKIMSALVELFDENAQYLRLCLAPILTIEGSPPEDASRILKVAQSIVDTVCKSSTQCPAMIRNALTLVRDKASRNIPEMAIAGVVNVLFLRYINPALVNPERYRLVTKRPSPAQQKLGLQIAKLLQSLVNAAMSEKFAPVADSLVTQANKDSFGRFLSELTADANLFTLPSPSSDPAWLESAQAANQSYALIRDFMIRHTAELFAAAQTNDTAGASLRNGLQQFMTVCLMEVQTKRV